MDKYMYEYQRNKEVNEGKVAELNKYISKNGDILVDIDNFTFDIKSLKSEIILSKCLQCEHYQGENCCYGNPYALPEDNRERLEPLVEDILGIIPDNYERLYSVKLGNLYTPSGSITTKGHPKGHCLFSYDTEDGVPKCAIHAYCLENGLNPRAYKPYTCSMFPLFAIRTPENKVMFFCHNKETQGFSPYRYPLSTRFCVDKESLKKVYDGTSKNKYYNSLNLEEMKKDKVLESYNPAYIEQEQTLRYFVGNEVYEKLLSKFQ